MDEKEVETIEIVRPGYTIKAPYTEEGLETLIDVLRSWKNQMFADKVAGKMTEELKKKFKEKLEDIDKIWLDKSPPSTETEIQEPVDLEGKEELETKLPEEPEEIEPSEKLERVGQVFMDNKEKVLHYVMEHPDCLASEVRNETKLSEPTVYKYLKELKNEGTIVSFGVPKKFKVVSGEEESPQDLLLDDEDKYLDDEKSIEFSDITDHDGKEIYIEEEPALPKRKSKDDYIDVPVTEQDIFDKNLEKVSCPQFQQVYKWVWDNAATSCHEMTRKLNMPARIINDAVAELIEKGFIIPLEKFGDRFEAVKDTAMFEAPASEGLSGEGPVG